MTPQGRILLMLGATIIVGLGTTACMGLVVWALLHADPSLPVLQRMPPLALLGAVVCSLVSAWLAQRALALMRQGRTGGPT